MSNTARIECIRKTDRYSAHDRISHVGGSAPTPWKLTLEEAIYAIESGSWQFYVHASGLSVWVVVARSVSGNKYLKTQNDGEQPNNLLSLPECP